MCIRDRSCTTPMMKPTPTICMAMSLEMPNSEQAMGISSRAVSYTHLDVYKRQRYTFNKDDVADYHYGREAIHNILYTIANSKAMNGGMPVSYTHLFLPIRNKPTCPPTVVFHRWAGVLCAFLA